MWRSGRMRLTGLLMRDSMTHGAVTHGASLWVEAAKFHTINDLGGLVTSWAVLSNTQATAVRVRFEVELLVDGGIFVQD